LSAAAKPRFQAGLQEVSMHAFGRKIPWLVLLFALGVAAPAAAEVDFIFKHDQFPPDIASAASQATGIPLPTQPGFVQGEGFGQVYVPQANQYPIKIVGIDLIMAAPPNGGEGTADATIEVWLHEGDMPGGAPAFSISTSDLINPQTGDFGSPLTGDSAMQFEFDWTDPEGHPPEVISGNFSIVVRFASPASDLSAEWGTFQCSQQEMLGMCGCQQVGTLNDQASTKHANLLSIIFPLGQCSGATKQFKFADDVGVTGDFILRARTLAAAGGPCEPDCDGKVCGTDGCGGACGTCGEGDKCSGGKCVPDTCAKQCDGKECGDDGCGGQCGECAEGKTCSDGKCTGGGCDAAANCAGKECGDDGCGGVCGICEGSDQCVQGHCKGPCKPQCVDKQCGDDGCGGVCGICEGDGQCVQGKCEGGAVEEDDVTVLSISPGSGSEDEDTDVSISGKGFQPGATVKLGGTFLSAVQFVSAEYITAKVPAGMTPGTYGLFVINPDGGTGTLMNAFEVLGSVEGGSAGGCSTGTSGSTPAAAALLLAAVLLWAARRVRS